MNRRSFLALFAALLPGCQPVLARRQPSIFEKSNESLRKSREACAAVRGLTPGVMWLSESDRYHRDAFGPWPGYQERPTVTFSNSDGPCETATATAVLTRDPS